MGVFFFLLLLLSRPFVLKPNFLEQFQVHSKVERAEERSHTPPRPTLRPPPQDEPAATPVIGEGARPSPCGRGRGCPHTRPPWQSVFSAHPCPPTPGRLPHPPAPSEDLRRVRCVATSRGPRARPAPMPVDEGAAPRARARPCSSRLAWAEAACPAPGGENAVRGQGPSPSARPCPQRVRLMPFRRLGLVTTLRLQPVWAEFLSQAIRADEPGQGHRGTIQAGCWGHLGGWCSVAVRFSRELV